MKRALSQPLTDLGTEIGAGFITITRIKMSPDLRIATLYISVFGGKTAPATALVDIEKHEGMLRKHLAASVHLRYVPELRFFLDDAFDATARIEELLEKSRPTSRDSDGENDEKSDDSDSLTDTGS